MTLVKVNPKYRRRSFFPHNFDHLFNDLINHSFGGSLDEHFVSKRPAVNVITNADNYQLEVAVPGLRKEDIDLQVEKQVLTISAVKKETTEDTTTEAGVKYSRREFDYATFKRTFHLNDTIDVNQINASYQDGVLLVTLPKKEEAIEKSRAIEIA
ncbi:MAG: Hsp20/alpha crystallin family protein [Bacteroidota bacterium]